MGGDKVIPELTGLSAESPEGKAIAGKRGEIFKRDFLPHLEPTPGASALLEWLRDDRKTLVIASSANDDELDSLLEIAGASKLIEAATSSDDAERSKPDPDIVAVAIRRTGAPAGEVIMVGDTPYDVEAALRAGIDIIGVRCGGWSDKDLHGAIAVYADPADLLAGYDLSPFRRRAPLRREPAPAPST